MNNFTKIDICSKALHKIGANEIVSFDEGTPEAEFVSSIYPIIKSKLLASYPWSFATKITSLNEVISEENVSSFAHTFMLPLDFLRLLSLSSNAPYDIVGDKLFSNASSISITYIADVDEALFPSTFLSAFIFSLASELALLMLEDNNKFNLFYKLYNTELKEARYLDSVQRPNVKIESFPLIDVRE